MQAAVEALFSNEPEMARFLRKMGFPVGRIPQNFDESPSAAWSTVFSDLRNGVMRDPYRQLLAAALHVHPFHPVLRPIAERYGVVSPEDVDVEVAASQHAQSTHHVIIRADNEAERLRAEGVLAKLGLEPIQVVGDRNGGIVSG